MSKILKLFTKYLPAVLAGIVAVESVLPEAPGATKKATVLAAVQAAAKVGEQIDDAQVSAVSTLIDEIVSIFNKTGFFTKKQPPA